MTEKTFTSRPAWLIALIIIATYLALAGKIWRGFGVLINGRGGV